MLCCLKLIKPFIKPNQTYTTYGRRQKKIHTVGKLSSIHCNTTTKIISVGNKTDNKRHSPASLLCLPLEGILVLPAAT